MQWKQQNMMRFFIMVLEDKTFHVLQHWTWDHHAKAEDHTHVKGVAHFFGSLCQIKWFLERDLLKLQPFPPAVASSAEQCMSMTAKIQELMEYAVAITPNKARTGLQPDIDNTFLTSFYKQCQAVLARPYPQPVVSFEELADAFIQRYEASRQTATATATPTTSLRWPRRL